MKDASSLLIMQHALKGPTAQKFLTLLGLLRLKADDLKVLSAYGEFYRSLVGAKGADRWLDHVLNEVLDGGGNPLSKACAEGEVPTPAALAAARSDLDRLQKMCIAESTLAMWVSDKRDQPEAWNLAAAALGEPATNSKKGAAAAAGGDGAGAFGLGFTTEDKTAADESAPDSVQSASVLPVEFGAFIGPPATQAEMQAARGAIAECWEWSSGLDSLVAHYGRYGHGVIARHSILEWTLDRGFKGVEGASDSAAWSAPPVPSTEELVAELKANVAWHAAGQPAQHALLHGRAGVGKRWAVRAAVGSAGLGKGVRAVVLNRLQLRNMPELATAIAKHPRVRFVVILDNLYLSPFAEFHSELLVALDQSKWPPNAIVCATSLSPTALKAQGGKGVAEDADAFEGWDALSLHFALQAELGVKVAAGDVAYFLDNVEVLATRAGLRAEEWSRDEATQWLEVRRTGASVAAAAQYVATLVRV